MSTQIKVVDTIYEIDGDSLQDAISKSPSTQAQVAEAAGYKGSSRITHIIKNGKTRISGKPMFNLIQALQNCSVPFQVQGKGEEVMVESTADAES